MDTTGLNVTDSLELKQLLSDWLEPDRNLVIAEEPVLNWAWLLDDDAGSVLTVGCFGIDKTRW